MQNNLILVEYYKPKLLKQILLHFIRCTTWNVVFLSSNFTRVLTHKSIHSFSHFFFFFFFALFAQLNDWIWMVVSRNYFDWFKMYERIIHIYLHMQFLLIVYLLLYTKHHTINRNIQIISLYRSVYLLHSISFLFFYFKIPLHTH